MNIYDSHGNTLEVGDIVQYVGNGYARELVPGDTFTIIDVHLRDIGRSYVHIKSDTTGYVYSTMPSSCERIPDDPTEFVKRLTI